MKHIYPIFLLLLTLFLVPDKGLAQESLSFEEAIVLALKNNYDIIVTKGNDEVAALNNRWGNAGRYPSIDFTGNSINKWDQNEDDDFRQNLLTGNVALNWMLFNGFSVNILKGRLNDLEEFSKGTTTVVIEGTIQAVILAYYKVLLEKERLEVLETVRELSNDRYEYEITRKELGNAVTFDVLQAQNSYLEDKGKYLTQKVVYRNSIRDLNFLMGIKEEKTWTITESFDPVVHEYALADLMEKMLANNNTLKNQFINQSLLEREVALAKSRYYPSLSLRGGIEGNQTRMEYDTAGKIESDSWNYFGNLTLSYNLYSGGVRHRAVQVAKINEDLGQVDIESLKHTLSNQLLNLYEFFNVRKELLEVADEAFEAAELNLQIAEEKFRTGAINSFNYRDVQMIYMNAALSRLQAVYAIIESEAALSRITGGIITEYGG